MWTATVRGMLAHKLRLVLTTASITLGVAFLAGTLMLTDTIKVAFDQLFGKVSSGSDAVVRTQTAYDQVAGVSVGRSPISAAVLAHVKAVDGVSAAEGYVSGYALLTDNDGKAVFAKGGAPTVGYSMPADTALRGAVRVRTGHAPTGPSEVAIDATSAEHHHIALGSQIDVLFRGPTQHFTVVGTVRYGNAKDLGGTTGAYFDTATAQKVLGTPGSFTQIDVRGDGTVSDAALAKRISAVLPKGAEAVTSATVAKESADAFHKQFKFLDVMFMVFAGIALFVGAFIIWNTFSMIVTQRSREIALLRAVGATRRQVKRSLLVEAALLGAGGSAIGIAVGAGVAKSLKWLMGVLGFALPSTALQIQGRTIWVPVVVGIAVTVVAALVPARRATKVLPVEALRDATPGATRPGRVRAAIGLVLTGGGVAAILSGLYSGAGSSNKVMLGILATLIGVITLSQLVARPLASLIGAPLRLRGVAGDLARQNAMRNPRRTASTASALMIGLALVISMGVFGSSLKASFGTVLDKATNADLYVTPSNIHGDGFSPDVTHLVEAVPGVATISATGYGLARFDGAETTYGSVDPATLNQALNLEMVSGSVKALGPKGVLVQTDVAKKHSWKVGDTVSTEFAATGKQSLQIAGTYKTNGFLNGDYILSNATHEANTSNPLVGAALVTLDKGSDRSVVQHRIADALAHHPDAKVLTQREYRADIGGVIDNILTFVSVMLLLAVVIALLGIVNTLALSVFERTRELGLLRAVGMTSAQVRAMVRWESVVISLLGATVGAGLGVGLGMALAQSLKGQGITQVSVPIGSVSLYLVAAAVAGVIAAIGPARSAARVDVLKAVVTD